MGPAMIAPLRPARNWTDGVVPALKVSVRTDPGGTMQQGKLSPGPKRCVFCEALFARVTVRTGFSVGAGVGTGVGATVGATVGACVGVTVRAAVAVGGGAEAAGALVRAAGEAVAVAAGVAVVAAAVGVGAAAAAVSLVPVHPVQRSVWPSHTTPRSPRPVPGSQIALAR